MDGSIVFARSHQCAPHLVHPNWYLHHTTVPLYSFKCHLVLLHSPAHKQLTHTQLVGWSLTSLFSTNTAISEMKATDSVWPPSNCPSLRFMLNACLHVRVINFRIIIIINASLLSHFEYTDRWICPMPPTPPSQNCRGMWGSERIFTQSLSSSLNTCPYHPSVPLLSDVV